MSIALLFVAVFQSSTNLSKKKEVSDKKYDTVLGHASAFVYSYNQF